MSTQSTVRPSAAAKGNEATRQQGKTARAGAVPAGYKSPRQARSVAVCNTKQLGGDDELAPLAAAALSASPVPEEVVIAPWGEVESSAGSFTVDEESARAVVEAFEAHGCDLPIDYEHQTLGGAYTSPTGQAPAAGWIKRLEARAGEGIVAHVQWTEPAAEQLSARQYRFLSPVAIVRKSDRKLVGLHSVALTNKPAIVGMKPIVNRDDACEGEADNVEAAAGELEATGKLRQQLALEPECSERELLVAAARRLDSLETERRHRQATDRVSAALAQGRLVPSQRDWAVKLCLRDEALFDEYVLTAPAVVTTGRLEAPEEVTVAAGAPGAAVLAARARAEFRAHPELAGLTSEEAYVAQAVRATQ
ncbi:MAG: hypothetical protein GY778_23450 [bacterium]|nr:hypothetical protein [bacterium]